MRHNGFAGGARNGRAAKAGRALLDINMPHVDGFKLTRMLKQAFPGICVVAITGQDSHQHRKQGRRNYAVLEGRPSLINLVIVLGSQGFTR